MMRRRLLCLMVVFSFSGAVKASESKSVHDQLLDGIAHGNLNKCEEAFAMGADLTQTALKMAIEQGDDRIIKWIIKTAEKGTLPRSAHSYSRKLSNRSSYESTEKASKKKSTPRLKVKKTEEDMSSSFESHEQISYLPDLILFHSDFGNFLHLAVRTNNHKIVLRIFNAMPEDSRLDCLNRVNREGKTPLHYAIENGNWEMAILLVGLGANVNVIGSFHNSVRETLIETAMRMHTERQCKDFHFLFIVFKLVTYLGANFDPELIANLIGSENAVVCQFLSRIYGALNNPSQGSLEILQGLSQQHQIISTHGITSHIITNTNQPLSIQESTTEHSSTTQTSSTQSSTTPLKRSKADSPTQSSNATQTTPTQSTPKSQKSSQKNKNNHNGDENPRLSTQIRDLMNFGEDSENETDKDKNEEKKEEQVVVKPELEGNTTTAIVKERKNREKRLSRRQKSRSDLKKKNEDGKKHQQNSNNGAIHLVITPVQPQINPQDLEHALQNVLQGGSHF